MPSVVAEVMVVGRGITLTTVLVAVAVSRATSLSEALL
jgi:hypothetical protein